MEHPEGVPISAILFGGRRREVAPLVFEARDWAHGVMIGAGMASETTAAAVGQVASCAATPMAMKPFCGYNFADYWTHGCRSRIASSSCRRSTRSTGSARTRRQVPVAGLRDNLRVLSWVIDRCEGRAKAHETPIGFLPHKEDLDLKGLDLPRVPCTSCSTSTSMRGIARSTTSAVTSRSSGIGCRRLCGPSISG